MKGKRILGVDAGTANLGIVVLEDDTILYRETWQPTVQGVERLAWVRGELGKVIQKYDIRHAVIEGYSYMSKWRAHDLGEMGGMIRLHLCDNDIKYSVVPPPTLKKYVCGKGNAKKEMMILHAFKKWKEEFKDTHQCDAYCLCRWLQFHGHK